jgi:hypothetical protein
MPASHDGWLTTQQTAALMNTTSAEVCRLLSIGRLSGTKKKHPQRPGKAQWLIDPQSIAAERRRTRSASPRQLVAAKVLRRSPTFRMVKPDDILFTRPRRPQSRVVLFSAAD